MTDSACAVVLHPDGAPLRLAVDLNGPHLIRTPLTQGRTPAQAAMQALFEIAGLETRAALDLGAADLGKANGLWHFVLCRTVPPVRERWQQAGADGVRRFGWHPLDDATGPDADGLVWLAATLSAQEGDG